MPTKSTPPNKDNSIIGRKRRRMSVVSNKDSEKTREQLRVEKKARDKERVVEILKTNGGIFITACQEIGISRRTIHRWRIEDTEFNEEILDVLSNQMSFVEGKLMAKVNEGDINAIRFYMRCKGRNSDVNPDTGWNEKFGNETNVDVNVGSTSVTNIDGVREQISDDALTSALGKAMQANPDLLKQAKQAKKKATKKTTTKKVKKKTAGKKK